MDPITVLGMVAAIAQLIETTSKTVRYLNDVKGAPKDRAKLAQEATNLLPVFTQLRYRVEEADSKDPWYIGIRSLGGASGPLKEFESTMEDLGDRLAPGKGLKKIGMALCWTLLKKDVDILLSKIERLKTLVGLALHNDLFKLNMAIKGDISAMKDNIAGELQGLRISIDNEKINQWLSAPDPSSNHSTAQKKKQRGTGQWFMASNDFLEWRENPKSFLWLNARPGCGKTVLCSTIIQNVIGHCQSEPTRAKAYFYFDFNDSRKQRTENLIRSLVTQFSAQDYRIPESLQSAYSQSQNGQQQPTIEILTPILRQVLENIGSAYIVLDALDECTDREVLLELLEVIMDWKLEHLHILVTSRKEQDIAESLESLVTCQVDIRSSYVAPDIRIHVLERLANDSKLKRLPPPVKNDIETSLLKGADGMFRWVICQLDSLRKCLRLEELQKALTTLPKTLDDTYERILYNLDQDRREDVLKILHWLCFSERPMQLDEMVEVLAIDSTDKPCFRPEKRLLDPSSILTICSTLVSVTNSAARDTDSSLGEPEADTTSYTNSGVELPEIETIETLRLAHFSVKEYFTSDRIKASSFSQYYITSSLANFHITTHCLAYLLYFDSPVIIAENVREYPLGPYAANLWVYHYKFITEDTSKKKVDDLVYELLDDRRVWWTNCVRLFEPELNLKINGMKSASPIYYMSYLGANGIVQRLIDKGADVNTRGGLFGTSLRAASREGHEAVVRILLEKGANVNAKVRIFCTALGDASQIGHEKVVRLLLEKGADIDALGDGSCGTALQIASLWGQEAVMRLLLENGANINAPGGRNFIAALRNALSKGDEALVLLLSENGADISHFEASDSSTALHAAYSIYQDKTLMLFQRIEKDVNILGGRSTGTALQNALANGDEAAVRLLLENGANIIGPGDLAPGTAVQEASFNGRDDLVQLLLEYNADVPASGFFLEKPWRRSRHHEIRCENIKRLLLTRGVKVIAPEEDYEDWSNRDRREYNAGHGPKLSLYRPNSGIEPPITKGILGVPL